MWTQTRVTRKLGIELPLIGAPMAGGPTTATLVAAISAAGGFGVLGGGYLSPEALRAEIRAVRADTDRPFGVNLFAPQPVRVDAREVTAGQRLIDPYARELGIDQSDGLDRLAEDFDEQLAVVVDERPAMFSFTFGIPPASALAAVRRAGIALAGTATNVAEARALAAAGVDMVCVQGAEAGGHRGTFLGDPARSLIGLVALVPQVRDAVGLPVIASGGIMDGRGIAAALALGADAAQLGSAFLLAAEAGTSTPYREAIATAGDASTVITTAFSGKPARGISNRMSDELAGVPVPPYPVMNAVTRELRRRATQAGRSEYLSLWAGQGIPLARAEPAAQIIDRLVAETRDVLAGLTG